MRWLHKLHHEDLNVWGMIREKTAASDATAWHVDPCSYGLESFDETVSCQLVEGNPKSLRITALRSISSEWITGKSRIPSPGAIQGILRDLFPATHRLESLRYLSFVIDLREMRSVTEVFRESEAVFTRWHLPGSIGTISIRLDILLPEQGSAAELYVKAFFENAITWSDDMLRLSRLESLTVTTKSDLTGPEAAMTEGRSDVMENFISRTVCPLKHLKMLTLELFSLTLLPPCVGELLDLEHLDLRGNALKSQESLPSSLANLVHLVTFNAVFQSKFEAGGDIGTNQEPYQEERRREPERIPSLQSRLPCGKRSDCYPSYETIINVQQEEHAVSAFGLTRNQWKCSPWTAVIDDFPMFRAATKMERFWVNSNRLTLTPLFFDHVLHAWPILRSLDLHDNDIHVDVSNVMKLKELKHLRLLQLQNNRLYGHIVSKDFDDWPRGLIKVDFALNRELGGCIHPQAIPSWLDLIISGTNIKVSSIECPPSDKVHARPVNPVGHDAPDDDDSADDDSDADDGNDNEGYVHVDPLPIHHGKLSTKLSRRQADL